MEQCNYVKQIKKLIKKTKKPVIGDTDTRNYLMARLLILNIQRVDAINNITLEEFD